MDRPKRTTRKPVKYGDQQTPVREKPAKKPAAKSKLSENTANKENIEVIAITDITNVLENLDHPEIVTAGKKTSKRGASKPTKPQRAAKRKEKENLSEEEEELLSNENESDEVIEVDQTEIVEKVVLSSSDDDEDLLGNPAFHNLDNSARVVSADPSPRVETPVRNTSGKYQAEYSKTSRAGCRSPNCHGDKITKGSFRIGKQVPIEYGQYGGMGMGWWHMECFFRVHSHQMKWTDFNGVEDLSVEDQKLLHLKACRCAMPVELLAKVIVTQEAVQVKNKEISERNAQNKKEAAAQKRQENAARIETVKSSTAEDLVRENVAKVIAKKTVDQLKVITRLRNIPVERGASAGKKKGAPKKADYQDAIINADPLCKIGSLVQRAIRKHIKVDELKVLLENIGLPKTGSKLELTKRLLDHFGGDFGEESEEETKPKKKKNYYGFSEDSDDEFGFGDYAQYGYDIYKKDDKHPEIVVKSKDGDLDGIKEILRKTNRPVATVNASRRWTEVEMKWGYDKSWEWHDATPLHAASEGGHVEIVYFLLTKEADPTLEGCTSDNVTDTPLSAVQKKINVISNNVKNRFELMKVKQYQVIQELLTTALKYWSQASYSRCHYSDERKKSFSMNPNKPRDVDEMLTALSNVSRDVNLSQDELTELEARMKEAREKQAQRIREELRKRAEYEAKLLQERLEREKRVKEELAKKEKEMKEREKKQKEEKERIMKEFQAKVRAAAGNQKQQTINNHNTVTNVLQPLTTNVPAITTNIPVNTTTVINPMDLADNGVFYEGFICDWKITFGFVILDSPPLNTAVFVHKSDVMSSYNCRSGTKLRFQLTKSLRKPGTVKVVNATIL